MWATAEKFIVILKWMETHRAEKSEKCFLHKLNISRDRVRGGKTFRLHSRTALAGTALPSLYIFVSHR